MPVLSVETADRCVEKVIQTEEFKQLLKTYDTERYELETHRHKNAHIEWVDGKLKMVHEKGWSHKSYRLRVYFGEWVIVE